MAIHYLHYRGKYLRRLNPLLRITPHPLACIMRLTLIIVFIATNFVHGQKLLSTQDSDTVFWYVYKSELVEELGLIPIDQSVSSFEFRFWGGNRVIRLWRNNGQLSSEVIFFIREYNKKKEMKDSRLYLSGLQLNDRATKDLYNLILDFEVLEIPTDKLIDGWEKGLDGITYFIEVADQNTFSFKSYWTPSSSPNVKEARYVKYFVNEVNSIKQIKDSFDTFMAKIPFKSYYPSYDGGVIAIITK